MITKFSSASNSFIVDKPQQEVFSQISGIKHIISEIKHEFDDHLTAINENTSEIQANYEYVAEVESKVDKLAERLDQIQMFLKNYGFQAEEEASYNISPLTKREQEVFLVLYTLDEKGPVCYLDIARKTALTEDLVASYITNLKEKGVPILKKYINNRAHLNLDRHFKSLQAKENILNLSQKTLVV